MKKYILGILLLFGIIVSNTAEDAGTTDPVLNGRWGDTPIHEYRFDNGVYEEWFHNRLHAKGIYTTTGGMLTINLTHMANHYLTNLFSNGWGNYLTWEDDMVSISQARTEMITQYIEMHIGWFGGSNTPDGIEELRTSAETSFDNTFGSTFSPIKYSSFTVRGNTLILKHKWGTTHWYKR